jgi:hypothetical protein
MHHVRPVIVIVIIITVVVAAACTPSRDTDHAARAIIDGSSCPSTVDPSALAIIYTGTYSQPYGEPIPFTNLGCTGTLIAPDVVLTAGHCVQVGESAPPQVTITSETYMVSFTADLTYLVKPASNGAGSSPPAPPSDAIPATDRVAHPDLDLSKVVPTSWTATSATPQGLGNYHDIGPLKHVRGHLERPLIDGVDLFTDGRRHPGTLPVEMNCSHPRLPPAAAFTARLSPAVSPAKYARSSVSWPTRSARRPVILTAWL